VSPLAFATGVAGLSIADRKECSSELCDAATSLERLMAARRAIDLSGGDVILIARTEGLLFEPSALKPAIDVSQSIATVTGAAIATILWITGHT
jgi:isocitrate lyase